MRTRVARYSLLAAVFIVATVDVCLAQSQPKNHNELDKHLGWVIGEWSAEMTTPDGQVQKISANYKWIAQEQVIRLDMKIGPWEGLSMILWDPSDETIKMWARTLRVATVKQRCELTERSWFGQTSSMTWMAKRPLATLSIRSRMLRTCL